MSQTRFAPSGAISERSTARYTCALVDATGAAIVSASLLTLTATLTDRGGAIINGRNAVSILNANGGTVTPQGVVTFILSAADTVALGTSELQERRLTLRATYSSGELTHEVTFYVRNLAGVAN